MRSLVLVFLAGCLQQPDHAKPPAPNVCGDGVCGPHETAASCPADCAPAPRCDALNLGNGPVDVSDSTVGATSAVDGASCGDGASAPAIDYTWRAPATGSYEITASGAFQLVVVATRGDCNGAELACQRVTPGETGTIRLAIDAGESIGIRVTGLAGAAGDFQLHVARMPDACGDGACEIGEDCTSCASDCGACPVCGDGKCTAHENCASCPADCGACTGTCGDGVCGPDESCETCASDCGTCGASYCGDDICDAGEDCTWCPNDCGSCPEYCGDGSCGTGEDCSSCPIDCGSCPEYCGDGTCGAGEDCEWCPSDCGSCPEYCGDGSCDAGEDCDTCPEDCGYCEPSTNASSDARSPRQ